MRRQLRKRQSGLEALVIQQAALGSDAAVDERHFVQEGPRFEASYGSTLAVTCLTPAFERNHRVFFQEYDGFNMFLLMDRPFILTLGLDDFCQAAGR